MLYLCVIAIEPAFYRVQIWKLTNLNLDLQLTARVWSSVIGWLSVRCILGGVVEFFSIRLLVASTFYQRIQCFLFIFCSDDSAAELSHHHHLSEPELDFLMNLMEWNGLECCLVGGTGCLWRCVPWWLGWYLCVPAEKLQDWRDSQIHGCNLFGVLSAVARVHSAAPPPAAHRGLMTYETTRHQPGKNKLKIYRRHRHIGSVSQTIFYMYWRISVIFPFSMRGSSKRDPAGWQTSWLKLVSVERLLYFWYVCLWGTTWLKLYLSANMIIF